MWLVNTLHVNLSIPVTAKFRVFPTVERTVAYAKMLERAGAQIIACHGRLREQRGQNSVSFLFCYCYCSIPEPQDGSRALQTGPKSAPSSKLSPSQSSQMAISSINPISFGVSKRQAQTVSCPRKGSCTTQPYFMASSGLSLFHPTRTPKLLALQEQNTSLPRLPTSFSINHDTQTLLLSISAS